MFNNIRIVLVSTSHPGNIGSAARALKTMGLSRLYLVNPKKFPDAKCTELAAGADDILQQAIVCDNLATALEGCSLVIGTSARRRDIPLKELNPRECGQKAFEISREAEVAIVFGREHAGLTNEELLLCQNHVIIPANEEYSSLNLAQAVQVICYEIQMAYYLQSQPESSDRNYDEIPTHEELEQFYAHMEAALIDVGFLKPHAPKRLLPRLRRLFTRSCLEKTELTILRGIFTAMQKKVREKIDND